MKLMYIVWIIFARQRLARDFSHGLESFLSRPPEKAMIKVSNKFVLTSSYDLVNL